VGLVVLAVTGWVLVALTALVCVGLFALGVVAPRRSVQAEEGVERALDKGEEKRDKAPGRLATWLRKPLDTSRTATRGSAKAGRKSRERLPF
jgi:hypothetical protein